MVITLPGSLETGLAKKIEMAIERYSEAADKSLDSRKLSTAEHCQSVIVGLKLALGYLKEEVESLEPSYLDHEPLV